MQPESDSSAKADHTGWIGRLQQVLNLDDAVRFAILARFWQLITGPLTQLLIVYQFSTARQDYYQAFSRMLGMQIFVELGLSVVLINVASHEWARLKINSQGRIEGDSAALSRLVSLGRMMVRWYGVATLLFVVVISGAGILFFADTEAFRATSDVAREDIAWRTAWVALVVLTGGQLAFLPLTAILEGCHQLNVLNRVRFWQALAGTVTVWLMVIGGFGLWALVGSAAVRLAADAWLVLKRFREFFVVFRNSANGQTIDWRTEILPLQWRIAVQGMLLWMASQMPLLVIFRYHEEGDATRLGMTWTILTALQSASLAWIETRRPAFGAFIADQKFDQLDQLFFRMTRLSLLGMILGCSCFCMTVWWINTRSEWLFDRLSDRMLPVFPTFLFCCAMILYQFALCTNLYVRAHKRDPFLAASVVSSCVIAGLQLWLGRYFGTTGVAAGYLIGIAAVQVPLWTLIWWTTRREWHQPVATGLTVARPVPGALPANDIEGTDPTSGARDA